VKYRERDEYQRWLFIRWVRELIAWCRPVYFLDECGVDHRLYNPYARAPRGERVYAQVHGSRRGRTSVISASRHGHLVCPFTFEGYCNREVVETYFMEILLPSISSGSIIVLDNASFHRSPALLALAEAAGVALVFLPTYSPDLNDIEHVWATLKCSLQSGLHEAEDKIAFIDKACLALCS
jgi:transposase